MSQNHWQWKMSLNVHLLMNNFMFVFPRFWWNWTESDKNDRVGSIVLLAHSSNTSVLSLMLVLIILVYELKHSVFYVIIHKALESSYILLVLACIWLGFICQWINPAFFWGYLEPAKHRSSSYICDLNLQIHQ